MRTSHRRRAAFTSVLTLGLLACSERSRESRDSTEAITDTITTPTMRRDLSSDLRAAEQALQQVEDSVDAGLGPQLAIQLHPLKAAFVTYRKEQCARLKAVFKDGTYGPLAELECRCPASDRR
ncbi:MAG TPA: lysozyme inhibitor LprI family protein [Gemmatimonadaceae bacterium]|nr:lysozyme inhibitor LprI family protein [Gemmatimonadaceae bacterium]